MGHQPTPDPRESLPAKTPHAECFSAAIRRHDDLAFLASTLGAKGFLATRWEALSDADVSALAWHVAGKVSYVLAPEGK